MTCKFLSVITFLTIRFIENITVINHRTFYLSYNHNYLVRLKENSELKEKGDNAW